MNSLLETRFFAIGLFVIFVMSSAVSAKAKKSIEWLPFDKALQKAQKNDKYIFVDIYADWCGYCKMLDATTYQAESVQKELAKNFVSIKLDSESSEEVSWDGKTMSKQQLAGYWGVTGLPTLLFLNPKGEIIAAYPSYADADLMINLLKYVSSGAREKNISFEKFLSSNEPT